MTAAVRPDVSWLPAACVQVTLPLSSYHRHAKGRGTTPSAAPPQPELAAEAGPSSASAGFGPSPSAGFSSPPQLPRLTREVGSWGQSSEWSSFSLSALGAHNSAVRAARPMLTCFSASSPLAC